VIITETYTVWLFDQMLNAAKGPESALLESIALGAIRGVVRHGGPVEQQLDEIRQVFEMLDGVRATRARLIERERRGT
jgi:hypothetical protein